VNFKDIKILAILLIYSPVLVLGNTHATICMTEVGKMQLEFGVDVCVSGPAETSVPANDCGDCTDSKIKFGETHRVALGNCDLIQSQTAFVSVVQEQHILPNATHFEPNASGNNLIGSSILII